MSVDRTRPQQVAGNALSCARFIAKACRCLFRRTGLPEEVGREAERHLKDIGLGCSQYSGPSLEDKWREELVILAREQDGRN